MGNQILRSGVTVTTALIGLKKHLCEYILYILYCNCIVSASEAKGGQPDAGDAEKLCGKLF